MKNEETSRETHRDNAEVRIQKACHKNSAFLSAFTLLEVMIAAALFGLVVAGTISVYIMCNKLWHATSLSMDTSRMASLALQRMVYGVETNSGLRAASMITLSTNFHGWPFTIKYWETNGQPPLAANSVHHICSCSSYPKDGSWRMTVSNAFDGVKYIEYNAQIRNIIFCPVTNLTSDARLTTAAEQKRILICNYVSSATVTTNASGTVGLQLTVEKRDGMFISSNTVSTSVKMRNKP